MTPNRVEGGSMGRPEFVDTHVHFWDLHHPHLHYSWLQPDAHHPQLGERHERLKTNYLVDDYIAETRAANVTKAIHVQAALGTEDPVDETEWLQAAAERTGFPHAIVAYADLQHPRVEDQLARHCQFANTRGIRDFSRGDYLVEPAFHRGFALLEKYGLVASLDVKWESMGKLGDLARRFPNTAIVLDHCGFPLERTPEYFRNWQQGISRLAEAENAVCKISGLGMCDHDWTVASIRPWVLHCAESFGPGRCIFATNWPVDKLFSTYEELVDAYAEIIAGFSPDERVAMLSRNAEQLYRI